MDKLTDDEQLISNQLYKTYHFLYWLKFDSNAPLFFTAFLNTARRYFDIAGNGDDTWMRDSHVMHTCNYKLEQSHIQLSKWT